MPLLLSPVQSASHRREAIGVKRGLRWSSGFLMHLNTVCSLLGVQ